MAHLRKITSVGSSALSRETANVAVRDIRNSYYGRICPIETPEGVNIGLVSNLALQTKVDLSGEILSPSVTSNMKDFEYLSSFQDKFSVIGDFFSFRDPDSKEISCRYFGQEFVKLLKTDRRVTNSDYSPFQILSLSSSILPFIEHSDASRMMIAANMLKQALVCARPQRSLIATGSEELIGHYSTSLIRSTSPGIVTYVDSSVVKVLSKKTETQKEKITTYKLSSFAKTNQDVAFSHQPVVNLRAKVKKGSVLAEGSGIVDGELFLGQNVVVAYLSFEGFNYEDAVVVSERVVKNDIFTSYTVTKYVCERYRSSIAEEKFSNKIPGVSPSILAKLDYRGFIKVGSYVKDGDILVGKISGAVRFESVGLMGKIQQLSQKLGETLTQLNSSLYAKRRT